MRYFTAILIFLATALPVASYAQTPALLASLPGAELDYYNQIFDYTMETIKPDGHYDWKGYDSSGSIMPGKIFISKSGHTCRKYAETFVVKGQLGQNEATACKRVGDDGWCRITNGNALTCALEKPEGILDEGMRELNGTITRSRNNLGAYREDYHDFKDKAGGYEQQGEEEFNNDVAHTEDSLQSYRDRYSPF